MHDYLFTTEVVRFAFMFGVAVSMILYERRHLTTGSIVVPGYIATFLAMPTTLIATFLNAFISYFLVNKLLRRWFLLYGRTKFTVLVVISIIIQTLMLKFSPNGAWAWESDIKLLVGVGYVVPALIAHDMGRQGIKKTFTSVMLAGLIVAAPIAVALAVDLPGINDLAPLRGGSDIAIDVAWIPIAVLLSAAAAWGVARFWNLRSGGFMGAAFVAILLGDPWQVIVMAALAAMTYVLVTRFLMNSMILFGRRKFSAMLLISASLSWVLLWVGGEIFGIGVQRHMDVGSLALIPLIVPGLMANDAQRTSPMRVLGGLSLATSFVLTMTWWLESLVERRPLDLGWKVAAVLTTVAIFGRTVAEQLLVRLRAANAGRRAVTGPSLAPAGARAEDSHWYGFAFASYRRWATLHQEASIAAEQWLATMLGETNQLAMAGAPASAPAPLQPSRPEPVAHSVVSPVSSLARIRAAAEQALHEPPPPREFGRRPQPLPTRRPRHARGEFDAIAAEVSTLAPRPSDDARVPSQPAVTHPSSGSAPFVTAPDAARASTTSRPSSTGAPISEPPDAATTRAHQRVASGARSNSTDHRNGSDEEAETTPFTG
jgi:poly-gamma-glutamate biosynthesis protein PgsC/CapC